MAWDGRCCTGQAIQRPPAGQDVSPWCGWRKLEGQVVTVLLRGWCLCPVSGSGSLGLGCWSSGGSWESQEHYFLCPKGSSREKRRLKVQSQQGQQAERGTSAEDCWRRVLWGEKERQEACKHPSHLSCLSAWPWFLEPCLEVRLWGTPYHLFFLSTVFPVRENQHLSSPLHITASTGRCHLGTQEQSTRYLLGSQGWNRNSCDLQALMCFLIHSCFLLNFRRCPLFPSPYDQRAQGCPLYPMPTHAVLALHTASLLSEHYCF